MSASNHVPKAPYVGNSPKLVVSFDVGTTQSSVSYCLLIPGEIPEIKTVTSYPVQEETRGASRIPTVIYYNKAGDVGAVGAEAMREEIYELAEDEGWIKAEWFKLHIRPKTDVTRQIASTIPPLPLNKTVVQVLADYLHYLFCCTRSFIQTNHTDGQELWSSLEGRITYIILRPDGWEAYQSSQMREAAVLAGLVPNTLDGHQHISFVTEGKAIAHFAVWNGLLVEGTIQSGDGIFIVNGGSGTVDCSTYEYIRKPGTGMRGGRIHFKEIAAPQCHFQGAVFVSINARVFLEEFLAESEFAEDLDHIVRCFDKTTRPRFSNNCQPQYIKFGGTRDNDQECNIRFGQLKLRGEDVASFFEPTIKCITDIVQEQLVNPLRNIKHIVFIGELSASEWTFNQVATRLSRYELNIVRPRQPASMPLSDGAVAFYLDRVVNARI